MEDLGPSLGHNDSEGNVFCGLCDWQLKCGSYEEIEFRLATHLRDAHGRKLLIARRDETGQLLDIPLLD